MYRQVKNPIPFNGLFYTPSSFDELVERIDQLPAQERALVYTFVSQALNVAHQAVEDDVFTKEVFI